MKDKITREEFDRMFAKDENGCYTDLIVPAMYGYPEMNLIGKKPEEYTIDEIVHSKKYRQFMHNKIIDNDIVIDYSKVISKDILQYHINNGDLKPLYLISPDFGGSEKEDNIVYVPDRIIELKNQLDEKLKNYIKEGNKVGLNCDLKYIGNSLVPSMIIINYTINQTNKNKEEILIWGASGNNINTTNNTKKNNYVLSIILFVIMSLIMAFIISWKLINK